MKWKFNREKLAAEREKKGLTQAALAGQMDMTKQYYQRIETGEQVPTIRTLLRISEALKCSPHIFFTDGAHEMKESKQPRGSDERR